MKLNLLTPKKALNKAFLKQRPLRSDIDLFKANLIRLLGKIDEIEREENQKNHIRDFLLDTFYKQTNEINTKDSKDLVIHLGKTNKDKVGVIIEAKRPSNKSEMLSVSKPNAKALHELILYYLNERHKAGNNELKCLIVTNVYEWYIIDANYFDKLYHNAKVRKLYELYLHDRKDTAFFYEEISRIIKDAAIELHCVFFDIRDYESILKKANKADDKNLIALFKVFSAPHLLKAPFSDDSNKLNAGFYKELLHIIGLEEAKENGKVVIRRKFENRNSASLIENTISILETESVLHKVPDIGNYGETSGERLFNIALELTITWVNRVLFLKLLEAQLVNYHKGDRFYRFLHTGFINDFDDLYKLFHQVLARTVADRTEVIKKKYAHIPYLNSSLFEISELEDKTIKINSLDNSDALELLNTTVLKEERKATVSLPTLDYLFKFLDAYDFASEGTEDIQEESKTLINASVLGKVFEKINGYRDGSIFTPGFITMYMCRKSLRMAVVHKFKEIYGWDVNKFDDIKNYIADRKSTKDILELNRVVNSIRLCDPAVGSGHFLVSSLNEIIAIKFELGILADGNGARIRNFEVVVENDELIVTDDQGDIFEYQMSNNKPSNKEAQRLQKTLFHEKQKVIEDCLFGVDINPKSVLICRLRLWIELLKNAYYKDETDYTELETLPNIDINIRCGNSLLSRFSLGADLSKALKSIKYNVEQYRGFVADYKNEKNREVKRGLQKIIDSIKSDFKTEISNNDPKQVKLRSLNGDLYNLLNQGKLFELDGKQKKVQKEKQQKLEADIAKLSKEIETIKSNAIYKNSFEWRFEFPEVLNNNGEFEGFDVVIGNPPYIQLQKLNEAVKAALEQQQYETFAKTGDIYQLFYELGVKLLKSNGHLAFITSNKWMRTDYGSVTRKFLSTKCRTMFVVDFGMAQMFDSATTYTNILILSKSAPSNEIVMCRVKDDYNSSILLDDYVDFASVEIQNPGENSWIAYGKKEYDLIKKIVQIGKPIKEWDIQINYGIKTGCNEAFIIDTATRDKLIAEDPKSDEIIKPILRGEDIKAYVPQWAGLWLINSHNGVKGANIPRIDVPKDYPAVYKWLSKFETTLSKRQDKGEHWTNLRNCAYLEDFYKPKIIYPNMTKFLPFVYDKHQFFTNDKSFMMTGSCLEFLACFLNSKVFKFTFKDYFPELLGETREVRKVFFETITIKPPENDQWYKNKLGAILENKSKGQATVDIENAIDRMIFDLYELTDSERAVLNNSLAGTVVSEPQIKFTSVVVSE